MVADQGTRKSVTKISAGFARRLRTLHFAVIFGAMRLRTVFVEFLK